MDFIIMSGRPRSGAPAGFRELKKLQRIIFAFPTSLPFVLHPTFYCLPSEVSDAHLVASGTESLLGCFLLGAELELFASPSLCALKSLILSTQLYIV